MAEFKFPCPACYQNIICDELWCGQQIKCPSCNVDLVVPQKEAVAASSSLVPEVPAGPAKLSIGRPQPGLTGAAHPAQKFIPSLGQTKVAAPKKNHLLTIAKIAAVVIVLGVGGYFGYGWLSKYQEKANEKRRAAEKNADGGEVGHIADLYNVLDATDPNKMGRSGGSGSGPRASRIARSATVAVPADGSTPAPDVTDKQLPVIAPVWTLDVASATIPEGQLNGKVAGTNFTADSARIDRVGTAQVLALRQGTGPSPDRELLVYLHLNPGETLAGHNWTVSQEMRPPAAPQVLKRWKTDPKFAPQQKFFSTGYAMKLELGQTNESGLPGKIFLALPDPEQSVVAGLFRLPPVPADATVQASAQPVINQAPAPAATAPASPNRAAFDKRYGTKR